MVTVCVGRKQQKEERSHGEKGKGKIVRKKEKEWKKRQINKRKIDSA